MGFSVLNMSAFTQKLVSGLRQRMNGRVVSARGHSQSGSARIHAISGPHCAVRVKSEGENGTDAYVISRNYSGPRTEVIVISQAGWKSPEV